MSTGKTSTTAYGVVCSLAKLARLPQWAGYFTPEMTYLNGALMRYGRDTWVKRIISALPPGLYLAVTDFLFIPGMAHHYLFRKRLIESQLTAAIAAGVRQVVVLGGGLDTLALRMAKAHPGVQFFEIDLPGTQQAKLRVLEKIGYGVAPNAVFLPADLSKDALEGVLRRHPAFKPEAPTLVVLEGVLMYLSEAEVKALFSALHRLFTGSLAVAFGAMATLDNDTNWRVRLFNAFLLQGQEKIKWHCPSGAMPQFVRDLGYELKEAMPYKTLQRHYRADAEIKNIPEEDENYYLIVKA